MRNERDKRKSTETENKLNSTRMKSKWKKWGKKDNIRFEIASKRDKHFDGIMLDSVWGLDVFLTKACGLLIFLSLFFDRKYVKLFSFDWLIRLKRKNQDDNDDINGRQTTSWHRLHADRVKAKMSKIWNCNNHNSMKRSNRNSKLLGANNRPGCFQFKWFCDFRSVLIEEIVLQRRRNDEPSSVGWNWESGTSARLSGRFPEKIPSTVD